MAGNMTQVGLEGMQAAQGNFETAVSQATAEANQVKSTEASLMGVWTGEAATTYRAAIDEWSTHFEEAKRALSEMHDTLVQTTSQYRSTHQETVDTASQTKSAMSSLPGLTGF